MKNKITQQQLDAAKQQQKALLKRLHEAINNARSQGHHIDGKCSMCVIGDEPVNGLHRGQYRCGNEDACTLCHNSGMEYGDQCSTCGRIEKNK